MFARPGPDDHFQMSVYCKESSGISTPARSEFQGSEFSLRLYHSTVALPGGARMKDNFCHCISRREATGITPQRESERDKSNGFMC